MEGTTAGALIPEIVRRDFQDLLAAEVSAANAIHVDRLLNCHRATWQRRQSAGKDSTAGGTSQQRNMHCMR